MWEKFYNKKEREELKAAYQKYIDGLRAVRGAKARTDPTGGAVPVAASKPKGGPATGGVSGLAAAAQIPMQVVYGTDTVSDIARVTPHTVLVLSPASSGYIDGGALLTKPAAKLNKEQRSRVLKTAQQTLQALVGMPMNLRE